MPDGSSASEYTPSSSPTDTGPYNGFTTQRGNGIHVGKGIKKCPHKHPRNEYYLGENQIFLTSRTPFLTYDTSDSYRGTLGCACGVIVIGLVSYIQQECQAHHRLTRAMHSEYAWAERELLELEWNFLKPKAPTVCLVLINLPRCNPLSECFQSIVTMDVNELAVK